MQDTEPIDLIGLLQCIKCTFHPICNMYHNVQLLTGRKAISREYLQLLSATGAMVIFYQSRLTDEPTGKIETCNFCGSWVMLQIVPKRNFFIK